MNVMLNPSFVWLPVTDEIEKELDQALARSEQLQQSILKSAFEGKLVSKRR